MKVVLDEENPDTYVVSMINGKKYTRITHTHTKKYGMSVDEYCQTYNVSRQDIICKLLRSKLSWTKKSCIQMYGDIKVLSAGMNTVSYNRMQVLVRSIIKRCMVI